MGSRGVGSENLRVHFPPLLQSPLIHSLSSAQLWSLILRHVDPLSEPMQSVVAAGQVSVTPAPHASPTLRYLVAHLPSTQFWDAQSELFEQAPPMGLRQVLEVESQVRSLAHVMVLEKHDVPRGASEHKQSAPNGQPGLRQ